MWTPLNDRVPLVGGKTAKVAPSSDGGVEDAAADGAVNDFHVGDPAFDTADFTDSFGGTPPEFNGAPGNLRVDYVLPRKNMKILDAGVFWPVTSDPLSALIGASDHRLVWVDVSK